MRKDRGGTSIFIMKKNSFDPAEVLETKNIINFLELYNYLIPMSYTINIPGSEKMGHIFPYFHDVICKQWWRE